MHKSEIPGARSTFYPAARAGSWAGHGTACAAAIRHVKATLDTMRESAIGFYLFIRKSTVYGEARR